jgi:hypothetical protein
MIGRALGKMADGMISAADTLRGLLDATQQRHCPVGAARALRESVEQDERLAALE